MANKRLNIRGGLNIKASLSSGAGDPVLTRDDSTTEVGTIPPVDTSSYISNSLNSAQLIVGNASNIAQARDITGAISFSNTGVTSINNGTIFNQHVANAAGILYSKLNLTGGIVNADINTTAGIERTKLASGIINRILINNGSGVLVENAAITPSRVIVSDSNGLPIASSTSTTVLGYLDISSSLSQLLANKLTFNSVISPTEGDLIQYVAGSWVNLGIGGVGTVLTSDGTNASWQSGASNGLPAGGTANQYLRKINSTDYNATWDTLTVSKITDLTATAAELNIMDGVVASTVEINYLTGSGSNIQSQLNNKLNRALAYNAIFVGDAGNNAVELAPGSPDQVLTMVGSVPQWQDPTPPGNVSGVAPSTDNAVARWNGIAADSIQNSGVIIDDSNNVTGLTSLSSGQIDVLNQAEVRLHETGSTNYVGVRASGTMASNYTITLPDTAPAANTYLKYDGANYVWDVAGGGAVSSVNGTTDRITVSPTTGAAVVDIAATYIGQSSITTLGTITAGIWNGSSISTAYTDAKIASITGTANRINISGTATDPIINISTLYVGQSTIITLGTITTGVWHGTVVEPVYGGTGQSTVTTGDLLYGSAVNTWARLAGVSTGNVLISGGVGTAPSWGKVTSAHVDSSIMLSSDGWKVTGTTTITTPTVVGNPFFQGNVLVGASGASITANTPLDVRGLSGNNIVRLASNSNTQRLLITDVGKLTGDHTDSGNNASPVTFNVTSTATANNDNMRGVLINSTQVAGGFTGTTMSPLVIQNAGSDVFKWFNTGEFAIGSTTRIGPNTGAAFATSGSRLSIVFSATPSITEYFHFVGNTNVNNGRTADLSGFNVVTPTINHTSGTANYVYNVLNLSTTVTNLNGGTVSLTGINYNPTLTVNPTTHYGIRIQPTDAKSSFGLSSPTARVHIAGGTTTLAPFKVNSGTALTTPEDGSLEYHSSHLYFTIGSTRYQLDQQTVYKTLDSTTTTVANVGTGEDVLYTYTIPANTLSVNKDMITMSASGQIGASGNSKRIRIYYGATQLFDTGTLADITGSYWNAEVKIYRVDATNQKAVVAFISSNSALLTSIGYTTPAETLSGTVVLQVTGEAVSNNEVLLHMADVNVKKS